MEDFVTVPLQDTEAALPVTRVSLSHIAFAATTRTEYPVVRLQDNSAYEVVPMKMSDTPSTTIFGI